MYNDTFNLNLKEIRKQKGMTQAELAQLLNVSVMTVRRLEAGTRTPKLKTIEKIAKALEVDPMKLTFGESEISKILEHSKEMYKDYAEHPEKYITEIGDDGKKYFYINKARIDLLDKYDKLNTLGQQKANEYITDLSEQEKYTKPDEEE